MTNEEKQEKQREELANACREQMAWMRTPYFLEALKVKDVGARLNYLAYRDAGFTDEQALSLVKSI